jgi:hypothetical protein
MPIWLRRLTYKHLIDFTNKEKTAQTTSNNVDGVTTIDFSKLDEAKRLMGGSAAYTTKASKK